MPSSSTSLDFLDRDQPWYKGRVSDALWSTLKARLTGGKDSAGIQYSSFVRLSPADADKIIAKMKEDPRGYPQVDQKGKDGGYYNLEAYQNWLVEEYLESNEPPGLDDILKEIREEKEEINKAPKPKVSKVKSSAIVPSKFIGESRYQVYLDELISQGTIGGKKLTSEERKQAFKKRGSKIDFETFVDKVLKKKSDASVSAVRTAPGAGGAIVKSPISSIQPFVSSPVSEKTQENLDDIMNGIDSILKTLREEQKLDEKAKRDEKTEAERARRGKREKELESKTFKGLISVVNKTLEPVKSLFKKVFDFISTVFLGRVVFKLVEWFSDDNNKEKLNAIGRFLKDTWPALLASYILFGTSFGRFITKIVLMAGSFIFKITRFAIPKLFSFIKKNPRAALLLGGGAMLGAKILTGNESAEDLKESEDTEEVPEMSSGGIVNGRKGIDKVPAMLTDGEFVMSRGAVQKYGTDTLAAMNAAGGGTNKPKVSGGAVYAQGGGYVGEKEQVKDPKLDKRDKSSGPFSWLTGMFSGTSKPSISSTSKKEEKKSGGGGTLKLSAQDFRDLAYIVSSEAARGTDDEYGVAASILNRVADPKWPNTIAAVGSQRGQYEAVYKGMAKDDPKLAAKLASPVGQAKIVEALKILKGRTDFKGQSQLGNKGKDDPMFSNRGNFFHYTSQVGKNDPAPANPPQHWKKLVGSGGPAVQIATTSGPSSGLTSFSSGGGQGDPSISPATSPPNIPPPSRQDMRKMLDDAMMAVNAPASTGQNYTKSPGISLPDFDAAVMHDSRKIKVLGMST